jgi:hypothetical protein
LKIVLKQKMGPYFIQKFTVRVDKGAADFTQQMKMLPAESLILNVLITGAFTVTQRKFPYHSLRRQFFQMPVDGSLPNKLFAAGKMAGYLVNRYMAAAKGTYIAENAVPLPGMIIRRTFTPHCC